MLQQVRAHRVKQIFDPILSHTEAATIEATGDAGEVEEAGGKIAGIEVESSIANTEIGGMIEGLCRGLEMIEGEIVGVDGNHTEDVEHLLLKVEDAHQIMDHETVEMLRRISR